MEELGALLGRPLVKEEDFGVLGDGLGRLAQFVDGFSAEQSAEVAQEDQQDGLVAQLVQERSGFQVLPFDRA